MRLAFATGLLALGIGATLASAEPLTRSSELTEMVTAAIDQHILPGYAALTASTARLRGAVDAWCAEGGSTPPPPVLAAFRAAVLSWARMEMIRFGPASHDNRVQKIAFWPDPRGVVRRQTTQALASGAAAPATREAIAAQSAAIQGLPALEIVLSAAQADKVGGDHQARCRLAAAIAANVDELSRQIADGWSGPDGWRQRMLSPGPANAAYKSNVEAASEITRSLLTGLQIVREQEIVPWLKSAEASRATAGLPYERSKLSKEYLLAGLESIHALQSALRLEEVAHRLGIREPDKSWMERWMTSAYEVLLSDGQTFVMPSTAATEARPDIKALRQAAFYANGLKQMIGREIAPAAGLLIGFNELDGD